MVAREKEREGEIALHRKREAQLMNALEGVLRKYSEESALVMTTLPLPRDADSPRLPCVPESEPEQLEALLRVGHEEPFGAARRHGAVVAHFKADVGVELPRVLVLPARARRTHRGSRRTSTAALASLSDETGAPSTLTR